MTLGVTTSPSDFCEDSPAAFQEVPGGPKVSSGAVSGSFLMPACESDYTSPYASGDVPAKRHHFLGDDSVEL